MAEEEIINLTSLVVKVANLERESTAAFKALFQENEALRQECSDLTDQNRTLIGRVNDLEEKTVMLQNRRNREEGTILQPMPERAVRPPPRPKLPKLECRHRTYLPAMFPDMPRREEEVEQEELLLPEFITPPTVISAHDLTRGKGLARDMIKSWGREAEQQIQANCQSEQCRSVDRQMMKRVREKFFGVINDFSQKQYQLDHPEIFLDPSLDLLCDFPTYFGVEPFQLRNEYSDGITKLDVEGLCMMEDAQEIALRTFHYINDVCRKVEIKHGMTQHNLITLLIENAEEPARTWIKGMMNEVDRTITNTNHHACHLINLMETKLCPCLRRTDVLERVIDSQKRGNILPRFFLANLKELTRAWVKSFNPEDRKHREDMKLCERLLMNMARSEIFFVQASFPDKDLTRMDPELLAEALTKVLELNGNYNVIKRMERNRNSASASPMSVSNSSINNIKSGKKFKIQKGREVFVYIQDGKKIMVDHQKANTKPGNCYKCNKSHMMKNKECPYFGIDLTTKPCELCHQGLHSTRLCESQPSAKAKRDDLRRQIMQTAGGRKHRNKYPEKLKKAMAQINRPIEDYELDDYLRLIPDSMGILH